ncbi:MAG: cytochrome c oxidase subunit II [Brumimicrobium sp.]
MNNKLIIVLVIILGVLAIAQMMRVNNLSNKIRKRNPEEPSEKENKRSANYLILFMISLHAFLIYVIVKYGFTNLGPAASVGGEKIDFMYSIQWILVLLVYFGCVTLLFYFAWKYQKKPGVKAYYYPYNDKLEMLWTVIPAAGLSLMVVLGLKTWNELTTPATAEYVNVEIFSEQFKWTARYSGPNNELGKFDYKLTTAENPFGIMTSENIETSFNLMKDGGVGYLGIKTLEERLNDPKVILSKEERKNLEIELGRKERMSRLLEALMVTYEPYKDSLDALAFDDVIVEDSLILLKGQKYNLHLRAKDVIHSAYLPHFRAQMNTVPGLTTFIKLQPTISTSEMKEKLNNPQFEYALMCNKICGTSHYKMKMSVKVLEPEEYLAWQKTKSTIDGNSWIRGNEEAILEYYRNITNSVVDR